MAYVQVSRNVTIGILGKYDMCAAEYAHWLIWKIKLFKELSQNIKLPCKDSHARRKSRLFLFGAQKIF